MIIEKIFSGESVCFSIAGRIDTTTYSQLRDELAAIPDTVKKIVFDFSDVSYISSSGIRELFICKKNFPTSRLKTFCRVFLKY